MLTFPRVRIFEKNINICKRVKEVFWLRRVLISLVTSLKENPHPFLKMADDKVGYLLEKGTVWGDSIKIGHGTMHMDAQCIFECMTSLADGRNIALWTEM